MKLSVLPVALALVASSSAAIERRPPPNNITPHLVDGWLWKDPFPAAQEAGLQATCEVTKHFWALEYTLHDLVEKPPYGLKPWAGALKKLFSQREYPGSWSGYDKHGYDRALLKMDYTDVPLAVRKWIEEQDMSDGEGKGLFGVFTKPEEGKDKVGDVVETPEGEVDRSEDGNKVVIFAPGGIYHTLPLWVAESSECPDQLLDLSKYKPTPESGNVVGWPDHKLPGEDHKAEFRVVAKVLGEKAAPPASEATADDGSKAEL